MADQQYCLRWNNHQNTLISVFDSLQERGCMVDCTLGAEGQSLQAHKVVLSACSPYLEDLLTKHYDKHPILILKDVRFEELKAMVDYMYRGEVNVAHDKLNLFLRAAESLQIKGLSDSGTDPPDTGGTAGGTKRTSKGAPVSVRSNQQLTVRSTNLADDSRDGSVSPSQRKRRRRRGSDESDNDSSSNVADGKQSSAAAAPVTGPSVLNQDLLPTVPASVPADALLSSIMESAETDTATDSGLYANAVTPSSQENVILDKGSSDVLVQPKTEYLDDDTQDLALGDDDSVAGPSHSRSGNFMNDTDMFMADQDGSNNAQEVEDTYKSALEQIVSDVFPSDPLLEAKKDLPKDSELEKSSSSECRDTQNVDEACQKSSTSDLADEQISLKERVAQRIADAAKATPKSKNKKHHRGKGKRARTSKTPTAPSAPPAASGPPAPSTPPASAASPAQSATTAVEQPHDASSSSEATLGKEQRQEQVVPDARILRPGPRTRSLTGALDRAKRCLLCRLGFATLQQLRQHSFFNHPSHVCKHCSRFFAKPEFARSHEKMCPMRYPYCPRCGDRVLSLRDHRCRATMGVPRLPIVQRIGSSYRIVSPIRRRT